MQPFRHLLFQVKMLNYVTVPFLYKCLVNLLLVNVNVTLPYCLIVCHVHFGTLCSTCSMCMYLTKINRLVLIQAVCKLSELLYNVHVL